VTHPDELLAEYVEGALAPQDRAEVQAHLEGCAPCRAEVADATEARASLRALPEVQEPPGVTLAVLREARERKAAPRWGAPLRVAAAVILIAGMAGGGIYVYGQLDRDGDAASTAGDGDEAGPDAGAPPPEADEAPEDARSEGAAASLSYPEVRRTGTDHDPESIVALAGSLRDEAEEALDAGLPADAFAFYETFPVDSFPRPAREALICAGQGLEPERSVVPFVIEQAAWDGEPAWVVSYLQGPDPSATYDRVQILVVHREECRVLHFAQQRL
jgi:hypothetical protein